MKVFLLAIAAILILVGIVWILQGINILPGSFMTGQIQWAFAGALAIVIALGLIAYATRRT